MAYGNRPINKTAPLAREPRGTLPAGAVIAMPVGSVKTGSAALTPRPRRRGDRCAPALMVDPRPSAAFAPWGDRMDTRERSITSQMTVPAAAAGAAVAMPADAEVQALLAAYEREVKVRGNDPEAARLYHEMGLLWEERLKSPRNAAVCYQNAYRLNPKYVPNLQSARSLFADVGNWQLVVQLLDAEAQVAASEAERNALLMEKAAVLEERLSRADEALALLQALAAQVPDDVAVLYQLEATYVVRGDHENLCAVYEKLALAVRDDAVRAHYYAAAAGLCEDRLKKPEAAADLYRKAFAHARNDPVLLAAVKRCAERDGKPDELLAALAAEAELAGAAAAPVFLRISRVYERLGRVEDALAALHAARRVSSDDPLALGELARIYETLGRFDDLAEVLRARVEKITDENELVALNLRLGALYEDKLKNEEEAIARNRAVLQIAPRHAAAITALGKLYFRRKDWNGLLESYEAEIAAAEDPKQKAARMYKAAELLEERLGRVDDAVARYNEILVLSPGYLPAQKALSRLYERQGRYAELIAMYEQDLLQTKDRDQVIAVLSRLSLICEEKLNDLARATTYLRRILEFAPNHLPTVRNLARLCERLGEVEELVRMNAVEADLASDTKEVLSLLHRNAEILEEQIGDRDRAVEAYKKVLALSPVYLPGLRALGRLYAQSGRWEELIEMYRQEAEVVASPEYAASLIYRAGELYEEKLSRVDQAIAVYQEVLTLAPSHFPALRALSRIYRAQGAWESLVDVLRAEAAVRTDPNERAHTLFRVAVLWEEDLARTDMAIESYQEVLRLSPAHVPALSALERLYRNAENWRELVAIHEREVQIAAAPADRIAAYAKLTRIYHDRLNEPTRAAQCCEAILAIDSQNLAALKGLERVRAADRLRRAELRARIAQKIADPRAACALLLASAQDRERAGAADAGEDLRRALALAPDDPRAVSTSERALRRSGDHAGFAAALERRMNAAQDPDSKLALAMRLGDLAERLLADLPRAQAAYRVALAAMPEHLPAIRGARRVAAAQGSNAEVVRLLVAEGDAYRDVRSAVDAYLDAGQVAQGKLNDPALARGAYGKALERDPLDPRASERYEELAAAGGGAEELATLHERRGDAKAQGRDERGAAEEYFLAARARAEKLGDAARGAALCDRALALDAHHASSLALRADLAAKAGDAALAAQMLGRRIEVGGEPSELSGLHARLGALYQDKLADLSRAAAHLSTAVAADPENGAALERLAQVHFATRNFSAALEAYQKLVDRAPDKAAQAGYTVALARVYDEGFNDATRAAATYQRAMELAPVGGEVVDRLTALYERTGSLRELVGILEQQANDSTDRGKVYTLRRKLGELHARAGDVPRAAASLRSAVELNPDDIEVRTVLADVLSRESATSAAGMEEHRHILKLNPFRIESLHALYRLYEASRQHDRAFLAASLLVFLKAASEAETAFYGEGRGRAPDPAKTAERLSDADIESVLAHPVDRSPLSDVLRIIGGDLHKVVEPKLEALGANPKADRLKADHPIHRMARHLAGVLGVEKFDAYLSRQGAIVALDNTDPLALVIGADLPRKFTDREQRFVIARGALGLRNRTALAYKLGLSPLEDLLGAAARVVNATFDRLGAVNPDLTKRIHKALPGRAIKALEPPVVELAAMRNLDPAAWFGALPWSADRFGLLACGDVVAGLNLLLREDPSVGARRLDTTEAVVAAVGERRDILELFGFVLSDDHYKLRARLKIGLA